MEETININAKGNILDVLKQMKEGFEVNSKSSEAFQQNAASSLGKIQNSLKSVNLAAFHQNLQNVNQGLQDLNAPGLGFNASLSELSALTGTTGKDLDELGGKARASAKEFGGTAAASVNTYKTILGRLGPDIAKNKDALGLMERNVQILSKTMGGDAAGAVDALTTGMLQFGVDLSNPKTAAAEMSKMMDVMANSAQAGAAEVPQISAALKVSGVAAKQAKVSFIETNAAIQALATGGKEGSEAGMALRNVLGKMAGEDVIPKEAAEKLHKLGVNMNVVSDTSLPFTTRLRELKKAQGDATIMAQVFGTENAAAANILLSSVDAQDELAKQIGKTGGAQEQANVIMESTAEKMKRMQASIEDSKVAFFEATGGVTAYLGPITEVLTTINSFSPLYSLAKNAVLKLKDMMTSTNAPMRTAATNASQAATNVSAIGTSSRTAGSMVAGFGTALKGVAIAAFIGLAIEAVHQFYKMASGADAAERAVKRLQRAKEQGEKDASKSVDRADKAYADATRKLEQQRTAGDISEKAYLERKIQIANNQQKYYHAEKENIKSLIAIHEENAKLDLKKGDEKGYSARQANIKQLKYELAGIADEAKEASNVVLDLEAEKKGGKKSLVSPNGYSPKDTKSASEKVMSGAGEVKRIDVRIENLIKGDVVIQSTTITEGMAQVKKMVAEAMTAAVRDFEVAI